MAASRGNPLMKDQWRAEDAQEDPRTHRHAKDKYRSSYHPRSPSYSSYRHRDVDTSSEQRLFKSKGSYKPFHPSSQLSGHRGGDANSYFSREQHHQTEKRTTAKYSGSSESSRYYEADKHSKFSSYPSTSRKRSRSLSPLPSPDHTRSKRRESYHPERSNRSRQYAERRHSPRRSPPNRGRGSQRRGRGRGRGSGFGYPHYRKRSRSPYPGDDYMSDRNSGRSRSPFDERRRNFSTDSYYTDSRSRKALSRPPSSYNEETMSTHHTHTLPDDSRRRSPTRHKHEYDSASNHSYEGDSRMKEAFPLYSRRGGQEKHGSHRISKPSAESRTGFSTSPSYGTPTNSRHASPRISSPYGGSRGSWGASQSHQQSHGYSPSYRQSNFHPSQASSQTQYFQNQHGQYPPGPVSNPSYRGGHTSFRGGYYNQSTDRRFQASNPQSFSTSSQPRPRNGHFCNLQWTASGSRGRGAYHTAPSVPSTRTTTPSVNMEEEEEENANPFRPSKDLQVEDEKSKAAADKNNAKQMPPPPQPKETGRFSFAFKSKAAPPPAAPKPIPDLAQRMRDSPRSAEAQRSRPPPLSAREKGESRIDRGNERRDSRKYDRQPETRNEGRHNRYDDRRRPESRFDRRPQARSPVEYKKPKRIVTRMKPKPTLPSEYVSSNSVYYRKPGNDSVIGAGTYGKVFKAIHVYTRAEVALKKIRMEGEKDGFPITAVREIKLLQHLRHVNVVQLKEVMVERNECFMVFEYLAHDLTGLINHPTFMLSGAHKKHLAKQMFEGLNYLHHRGVLHRDIKAANILISSTGELKYADFGLARFFSKSRHVDYTNRVITIWFRPPELLLGETQYGPAVDIWSAACVWMEMFTKKAIFPGDGGEISQLDKLYNCLGTPTRADWPAIVEMPWFDLLKPTERKKRVFEDIYRNVMSPAALDLVAQMFRYDPAKRPSAEEVLKHPYFVSEEPAPEQAVELAAVEGDWHEFESKALRKERDREARRLEYHREKEKRRLHSSSGQFERDTKRTRLDSSAPSLPAEHQHQYETSGVQR